MKLSPEACNRLVTKKNKSRVSQHDKCILHNEHGKKGYLEEGTANSQRV